MSRFLSTVIFSVIFVFLSTTVIRFLAIGAVAPDIVLVWIVYVAIRDGQSAAMTTGFFAGLLLDLLAGPDGMLGLSALSKTLAGFGAGYFFNENKTLQTLGGYQFLVILAVSTLVHNLVYFLIFLQGSEVGWMRAVLGYGLPATLYTTAAGLLPMFVFARKHAS